MPVALKKDLELMRSKFNETSEKLMEKSRQYQKLQVGYSPWPSLLYETGTKARVYMHPLYNVLSLYRECMRC